jgi:hypothetical protein
MALGGHDAAYCDRFGPLDEMFTLSSATTARSTYGSGLQVA